MASLKCIFCGYGIHHHGYPEFAESVEYIFCTANDWAKLEVENMACSDLESEYDGVFYYVWRCMRCGTFSFINDRWDVVGVYTPNEEFSSTPMQEPIDFGPFWDEFLWYDINETDILASEVLTKYPQNLWLAKNDDEMRLYSDKAMTDCVAQFRRFHRPKTVTVATMSLTAFKKMLLNYDDEIDFFYQGVGYEFIKNHIGGGRIKIIVNRDFDNPKRVYEVEVAAQDNFTDDLVNAKIFPDGKSIADAAADVNL